MSYHAILTLATIVSEKCETVINFFLFQSTVTFALLLYFLTIMWQTLDQFLKEKITFEIQFQNENNESIVDTTTEIDDFDDQIVIDKNLLVDIFELP